MTNFGRFANYTSVGLQRCPALAVRWSHGGCTNISEAPASRLMKHCRGPLNAQRARSQSDRQCHGEGGGGQANYVFSEKFTKPTHASFI